MPKIFEKIIYGFSQEMRLALLAGCELEHEWKPELNKYIIRTKYPIAIVKQKKNGFRIVYEDHGGISPEIKAIL